MCLGDASTKKILRIAVLRALSIQDEYIVWAENFPWAEKRPMDVLGAGGGAGGKGEGQLFLTCVHLPFSPSVHKR